MSALTDLFGQIADAIRAKSGSTGQIQASAFPTEIANIASGADVGFYTSTKGSIVCDNLIGKTYYAVLIQERVAGDFTNLICGSNCKASPTEWANEQCIIAGELTTTQTRSVSFDNTTGTLTSNIIVNVQKYLVIGW